MLSFVGMWANKVWGVDHRRTNFVETDLVKICWAVRSGEVDLVRQAIAAAKEGRVDLNGQASWFESKGTSLDLTASSYLGPCTPLTVACYTPGRMEIVKLLLDSELVDINSMSGRSSDHTPLDCAIIWNANAELIKFLMDRGGLISPVHSKKIGKMLHGISEIPIDIVLSVVKKSTAYFFKKVSGGVPPSEDHTEDSADPENPTGSEDTASLPTP